MELLQRALAAAEVNDRDCPVITSQCLASLGRALLGLNRFEQAEAHLARAVQRAGNSTVGDVQPWRVWLGEAQRGKITPSDRRDPQSVPEILAASAKQWGQAILSKPKTARNLIDLADR